VEPRQWLVFFQCLNFFFCFAIGACLGSFLNVCALRIPEGLSIVRPPSHCPRCGHSLPWYENIPILSFLILRGRCRSCKNPISWQYPLVEALTGVFFTVSALHFWAEPWKLGGFLILGGFCIVLSSIDIRTLTLPNAVVFPLMAAATLFAPWNPWLGTRWDSRLVDMVLGFLVGAGILFLFGWLGTLALGKDALGGGDIKLLGVLGMVLGWQGALDGLFFGSLLSGLWGGSLILSGRLKAKTPLPYGPFLCAGCLATALWPFLGLSFWMAVRS
jgi:leader peptidase (prepilin peptidase)/N-methyltransferase